jgi:hypothetical protein
VRNPLDRTMSSFRRSKQKQLEKILAESKALDKKARKNVFTLYLFLSKQIK